MDNNNYGQQFAPQRMRPQAPSNLTPTMPTPKNNNNSFLPIVISIILAVIVLVESIALVFLIINSTNNAEEETSSADDDYVPNDMTDGSSAYTYDDNYNLTSFSVTCTSEQGDSYIFDQNRRFEKTDANGEETASGTYSILNSTLITLRDAGTDIGNVFYDGIYVVNGTTFYTCVESDAS